MINAIKQKLLAGEPALGIVLGMGSPTVAGIAARSGFDFVLVDNQHGDWDDTTTLAAFRAISLGNAIPVARVRQNDFYAIGRLLDRGALGIVVPMVNSPDEARAAAFAMRYPPHGGRSFAGSLAVHYGPDYDTWADRELFLAVQIETARPPSRRRRSWRWQGWTAVGSARWTWRARWAWRRARRRTRRPSSACWLPAGRPAKSQGSTRPTQQPPASGSSRGSGSSRRPMTVD